MGFKSVSGGIRTKIINNPKKEEIASPLSSYLSQQVGQGVPRYEGNILSKLPQEGQNRISEFLSLNPSKFFDEKIQGPALATFKEDVLPLVREQFAGSLSGSRRFRTEEEAGSRFVRGLAEQRANLELSLPQAQAEMAIQVKESNDKEFLAQYQDWYKSLSQNNPAIAQSLQFLQESTNTGKTILSFLDPGKKGSAGIMGSMLGFAIGALLAAPTGGMSLLAGGAIGSALGGAAGAAIE